MNSQADQQLALWQNAYWEVRDENTELKTQITEKNEQISQMRRELNVANNKVAKLQQIIPPNIY